MSERPLIIYDDRMLEHHPTGWDPDHPEWTQAVMELLAEQYPDKSPEEWSHPERPERLTAIRDRLRDDAMPELSWEAAEPATNQSLARVHAPGYVSFIDSLEGRACWLNVDTTAVSPGSVEAAKLAAGAGIRAVDAVMNAGPRRAFSVIRPPGHHATADSAMGFCLFNNVAVAAAHARAAHGCERVMIFDWDLHHGNGTQEIFYRDPGVLFVDLHCAAPFYPGTGHLEERGAGAGQGTVINVPLPAGSGNSALLATMDRVVAPAAAAYRPELILVSAGFDAHYLDQTMFVDESGFATLTARLCELSDRFCEGRLVLMLEGGYHADALAGGTEACVRIMAGETAGEPALDEEDPGLVAVDAAAGYHRSVLAV